MFEAAVYLCGVVAVLLAWRAYFTRYHRQRALLVLQWLEGALSGSGRVTGLDWISASRFHVPLKLRSGLFRRPAVRVELAPRQHPWEWLLHRLRRRAETLTFEADFDAPPGLDLQLHRYQWCGRTTRRHSTDARQWDFESPTPVIITTREEWQPEVISLLQTLLSASDKDFVSLTLGRRSPHFSATVPLGSIHPRTASGDIFRLLGELAAGASAQRL